MPCSALPAPKCMTTTRLIWKLRNFSIRWILQTKCVGMWVKFHNLGILLLAWYQKRFLTIIGGRLGFWRLWWHAKKINFNWLHRICHPQKHISRGKFCIFQILRSWDKEISLFGLFFRIFTRGNFSTQIWSYLKNRSIYQLGVNAAIKKVIFWLRLVNFVFIGIKLYFPLPQNLYF